MKTLSHYLSWPRDQFKEIADGGFGVFLRKVRNLTIKLVNGIWAIPVVLFIRVIRPVVTIRLGTLNSGRIGHFVADGAEQLARLQQQQPNTVDFFWLNKTCNSQWERMIRRTLPVHPWVKPLYWWNRAIPGGAAHMRPSSYTQSRDIEGLYTRYDVQIPFLPAEIDEALTWLRSKGWTDGEPFVCLLVRDDEYLANDPLHGNGSTRSREIWAYHDYRNSDIDTYVPAIEWLTQQGVWVIRMGKIMGKPLPTGMDHVIDYAFDPSKSDLLDIWLFANCNGSIGTSTGLDMLPSVYGVPQLFVNALPLSLFLSWGCSIWVPKKLHWATTARALSCREYLENNWLETTKYEIEGISITDLSSEEITEAVQEFWHRCIETWQEEPDDKARQDEFREIIMAWPEYLTQHGWIHSDARIGAAWLRSLDVPT